MAQFKTTAAYLSGAICGRMWWPVGAMAGKPISIKARGPWGFMDCFSTHAGTTLRDGLNHILNSEGGDFQNALFTDDTELVIERRAVDGPGKYRVHMKRIPVSSIDADLVAPDTFASDFMGEGD